jgi:acyl-CoA thioester hydrolase
MPEVEIERRVEWSDTDAAGHQHYTAILRWAEAAEAELLRSLGLDWLFGRTPRVRHEVDYTRRLWFGDIVRTRLWVDKVGRTSTRFLFEVHGPKGLAAQGSVTVAHTEPDQPKAAPWTDEVRALLTPAPGTNP